MNLENIRVGNAAGTIKTLEQVEKACNSAMTEITVGSITLKQQDGNKPDKGFGRVYYYHPTKQWSLNALGMPNMGLEEFLKVLPEMAKRTHAASKKLRVSVAGYSPEEYATLTSECYEGGADEVELNLGCPNVWGPDGSQKPIPSFDPLLTRSILTHVVRKAGGRKVGVKISPVDRMDILEPLIAQINHSGTVSHVVACNTIPNEEDMGEDGHPALSFNIENHKGGRAGKMLFQHSLMVCDQVRRMLHEKIELVGVGGIFTGAAAKRYLDGDCSGFQCATAYVEQGERLFSNLLGELVDLAA